MSPDLIYHIMSTKCKTDINQFGRRRGGRGHSLIHNDTVDSVGFNLSVSVWDKKMKRNRPRHHQRKPTPRRVNRKPRELTRMPSIRTETARTTLTWKTEISIMCIMFTIALLVGFALMAQYYEYYSRPKDNDKHELYMLAFPVWQLFDTFFCRYGQYDQYEITFGGGGDALWILIFPMAVLSTMMIMGILSFMKYEVLHGAYASNFFKMRSWDKWWQRGVWILQKHLCRQL